MLVRLRFLAFVPLALGCSSTGRQAEPAPATTDTCKYDLATYCGEGNCKAFAHLDSIPSCTLADPRNSMSATTCDAYYVESYSYTDTGDERWYEKATGDLVGIVTTGLRGSCLYAAPSFVMPTTCRATDLPSCRFTGPVRDGG